MWDAEAISRRFARTNHSDQVLAWKQQHATHHKCDTAAGEVPKQSSSSSPRGRPVLLWGDHLPTQEPSARPRAPCPLCWQASEAGQHPYPVHGSTITRRLMKEALPMTGCLAADTCPLTLKKNKTKKKKKSNLERSFFSFKIGTRKQVLPSNTHF